MHQQKQSVGTYSEVTISPLANPLLIENQCWIKYFSCVHLWKLLQQSRISRTWKWHIQCLSVCQIHLCCLLFFYTSHFKSSTTILETVAADVQIHTPWIAGESLLTVYIPTIWFSEVLSEQPQLSAGQLHARYLSKSGHKWINCKSFPTLSFHNQSAQRYKRPCM